MNILKKTLNMFPKLLSWFFQSSWKKKIVIIVMLLIVGFFIGWRLLNNPSDGYIFGTVQTRTITEVVSESGAITANGSVRIYSPTNGVVAEVFVSNNEGVKEKQKLFTVKSTATPQEKATALAAFQIAATVAQQAENTRRSTKATVDRVHDDLKDVDSESFSQKETRTTAEVAHDNAFDALKAARADLVSKTVAYQATQNATITAPVSGLISNLSVASGNSVSVNSILTPSSPVLMIGGLGITEVTFSVGETDINKIEVDQEVEIEVDAVKNKTYKGIVKRVDKIGTTTQSVVNFNVYIELLDPDDRLRGGMTVDIDIVTEELKDVLAVPSVAVKPYQKGRAVRVLGNNGEIEFIPVKIGVRGRDFTQIIEGLEEGQEIIVSLTDENRERISRPSPLGF